MARKIGSSANTTGPRIRDAARHLFARHGFAAVSMRQIAAHVGVQAGALYLYTPDKQALLFDLMQDHMITLLAALNDLPPAHTPAQRLTQFARFHIGYHLDRPEAVFIAYMELRNLTPENFTTLESLRRAYEDHLHLILQSGRDTGAFTLTDPKLTTYALIAMLTGVTNWYRDDGRLSRDDVQTLYANMALRAVGAHP
ncbi:transcriptional regulator, TetR family [Pseudorhodobacter antarcticus]|jgi:AcrR family transcriptional regulator|uniref:Transcriptional regulator, TetR family n=1 Tax=Pseudorhodobacter antarcticus TaxID=1077947 RepID=A0A1H8G3E3_9RHOB|nr:TetR/AcrR family transcriptional regulator [Pseudorhodobacter antarcticus]SEN37808.1 transcriptional regulator, TetR family [Pseudorhodobacter antarcticus]